MLVKGVGDAVNAVNGHCECCDCWYRRGGDAVNGCSECCEFLVQVGEDTVNGCCECWEC